MTPLRIALATAAAGITLFGTPVHAEACVRTAANPHHEVCVLRDDCLVYVWSSMPPALCV